MVLSILFYAGAALVVFGVVAWFFTIPALGIAQRSQGALIAGIGVCVSVVVLLLPPSETQIVGPVTQLDRFVPR
jgi:hypothetical protein